jgi:hypothetical protein
MVDGETLTDYPSTGASAKERIFREDGDNAKRKQGQSSLAFRVIAAPSE